VAGMANMSRYSRRSVQWTSTRSLGDSVGAHGGSGVVARHTNRMVASTRIVRPSTTCTVTSVSSPKGS
jgi:hypothetical protein